MGIVVGTIASSVLWLLATGAHHRQHLRLEPTGHFHAFFTGDRFFVTCSAGANSGATRLTWQAPTGRDITLSTGRVHVEAVPEDPNGLELVFEDVRYEDRGKYLCSAIVDGREAKTHFMLTVYLSITFWGTPEHQYGKEGDDFLVSCNVRADPSPVVYWYVNGSLIQGGKRHAVTEDGLFIRGLKPSDFGNYTCRAIVVTPHTSQIKDRVILLHVHYRPVWHAPHMDVAHGTVGSSSSLVCAAHSQPPPIYEWFRERALLGNSKTYRITNQKWKSILQVKIKDSGVFGNYVCVVSNSMGEIRRTITLVEGVVPEPPEYLVESSEPGLLTIKVSQPASSLLPVYGYRIEWKLKGDKTWHMGKYFPVNKGDTEYYMQNLSFESDYAIRLAAKNAVGYSNYSEESVHRTRGLIAETVVDGSSMSSSSATCQQETLLLLFMFFLVCRNL